MRFSHLIRAGAANAWQNRRVIWLPWLAKLALAFLMLEISGRAAEFGFTRQSGFFLWWMDIFHLEGRPPLPIDERFESWSVWIFFPLENVLHAAVVGSLGTVVLQKRILNFFRYGIRYVGRFLRISLLGFVPVVACYALCCCLAGCYRLFHLSLGSSIMLPLSAIALVFAIEIIADFARVQTVVEERSSTVLSWLSACRFVWQNGRWVAGISLLKVLGVLVLLAVNPLSNASAFWGTRITSLILLVTLWLRIWLAAVTYATQIELVRVVNGGPRLFLPDAT
ncbi:MAG TPA: hypothetical protein VGQ81_09480 [Acidobacteriota bacterium]|jgi:hypothetical protein|nr:hypothetical protein [Acidobacteriota bacterium]